MSHPSPKNKIESEIENIVPILHVASLEASIKYYNEKLSFTTEWSTDTMASVSRDGLGIMLCQQGQGQPGMWIWIGVHSVARLYEEFIHKGATILQKPTNYSWAYEMRVGDLDGHVLRFGSEPLPGQVND